MKNDDEVEADHDETTATAAPTPPQTTRKTTTTNKNNNKTKKAALKPEVPEITLYEILGVAPTATREELKLRYNALARRYHPDAVRLRPKLLFVGTPPTPPPQTEPHFGEIAAAWKLLSDETARRKYDRSLLYKRWAEKASNFAFKTMEDAAPVMAKMMDDVAVPLIQKTAQSTVTMARAAYRAGQSMKPTKDAAKTKEPPMTSTDPVGAVSMDEVVSKIRLPKWNPNTASAEKTPLVPGIPPPTDKDSVQPFFMEKVNSPKAKPPKTKPPTAKPPKTKPPKADTMHLLFWTLLKMIVVF
jgi:curved DNA-binding protein CbpA